MRTMAGLAAVVLLAGGCTTIETTRAKLVKTQPHCVDQTVQIYFEPQSAELTHEARMVIDQAAAGAASCRVTAVDVVGLSDAAGTPGANLELSRKRADAVAAALAANGLPPAAFKVEAEGQAGAVTDDGKAHPVRRRADVTLRLAPKS